VIDYSRDDEAEVSDTTRLELFWPLVIPDF
jgi:hypothetical protein